MDGNATTPAELLQLSGAYWQTCALHAAVGLDLFSAIGDGQLSAPEIARISGCDNRALVQLLNALCAMNLLEKEGETYRNTSTAKRFLCQESLSYVGFMIRHHHHLVESWSRLDEAVRSGEPVRPRINGVEDDEERRESFLMGMFNLAMGQAPELVPTLDLEGRNHLLDLGGGPGTWAIHFCRHNPGLTATVFDLPSTRPFAERTVARFGLRERIRFEAGDFLHDPIPGTYDVAWLSHVLHGEGPDGCLALVRQAATALASGGLLIIHDFILDDSKDGPLFPALFSLNMLLGTGNGRSYSEKEVRGFLEEAGIKDIRRTSYRGPTDSGVILGIKA